MKKGMKIVISILAVIILLAIIFFSIDYNRVKNNETPIFCIKNSAGVMKDGGSTEYFGIGYKVIAFDRLSGYNEIKIGTWSMQYEDFKKEYEKLEKEIMKESERIVKVDGKMYYDTREESNALRCGLMDGKITSTVKQDELPTIDYQSNFGIGYEYQYGDNKETIEILINHKWIIFKLKENL